MVDEEVKTSVEGLEAQRRSSHEKNNDKHISREVVVHWYCFHVCAVGAPPHDRGRKSSEVTPDLSHSSQASLPVERTHLCSLHRIALLF
jgi:hypothetical protein